MKLTNLLNLPQPIVDAVANDSYSRGDAEVSVTGLLRPPRISALEKLYESEITEDAADRIWSLVGQVVHGVLERADKTGIAERRLFIDVGGIRVSGQMDRYVDGVLQDYKFVTAYKFKDKKAPKEFEEQLNCYAEILRQNGHEVKKLQLVGILRDWSKLEARRDASYPQKQVTVVDVPLWPQPKAMAFLMNRVEAYKAAHHVLPECSPEERWARPNTWAVIKPGASRATKLYDNEKEAKAHAERIGQEVEYRPGENVRCANYCSVSSFCVQFKKLGGK